MILKFTLYIITILSVLGMFAEEGKRSIYGIVTIISLLLLTVLELIPK